MQASVPQLAGSGEGSPVDEREIDGSVTRLDLGDSRRLVGCALPVPRFDPAIRVGLALRSEIHLGAATAHDQHAVAPELDVDVALEARDDELAAQRGLALEHDLALDRRELDVARADPAALDLAVVHRRD